jgi:hypothetical protein
VALLRMRGGREGEWVAKRALRAAALAGLATGLLACGASTQEPLSERASDGELKAALCLDIAAEYMEARQDAVLCDVESEVCAARRPLGVVAVDSSGAGRLTGLTSCAAPVNAARTAKLDEVLQRYTAAGCDMPPSPGLWNKHSPEMDGPQPCHPRADGMGSCSG